MATPDPNSDNIIQNRNSMGKISRSFLLTLGLISAVTVVFLAAINIFESSNSEINGNTLNKEQPKSQELSPYSSTKDGFTVLMPKDPTISQATETFGTHQIPANVYNKSVESGAKDYTVIAYDFSGIPIDPKATLDQALNNTLGRFSNAQIESSSLADSNSLKAIFNVAKKDKLYESHAKYIFHDNQLYALILVGGDEIKFNEFYNSLKFN